MNESELAQFTNECPTLYHVAAIGSWPFIKKHGLLSVTALLDLYDVSNQRRQEIELTRRSKSIVLTDPRQGVATIRDQQPIHERKLSACLEDGLTAKQWYKILNSRVFFWTNQTRLRGLLGAKEYKAKSHEVIEVDTARLIQSYRNQIQLSRINSGSTSHKAAPRGLTTFQTISECPYHEWRRKHRSKGDHISELTVLNGVPDLEQFVIRVVAMNIRALEAVVWQR